jgi:peptidyl-tRNA hydrolase, PTH2 family
MNVKMVLIFRRDLQIRRGKELAQAGHGACTWLLERMTKRTKNAVTIHFSPEELYWIDHGQKKVVCHVPGLLELRDLHDRAELAGLDSHLITDAGYTEFKGQPTITCLAIGPDRDEVIDKITGELKLY